MRKLYFSVLALLLLSACGPNNDKDKDGGKKPPSSTVVLPVDTNVVFTLSMLANLPAATYYWDQATAPQYIYNFAAPMIDSTLHHTFDTTGGTPNVTGWTRVWGPVSTVTNSVMIEAASLKAGDSVTVAYVSTVSMTIFQNGNNFVVGIQATNPYCNYAWDSLDFNVKDTMPWSKFYPGQNWGALSRGTYLGLNTLIGLQYNNGQTPVQFLDSAVAKAGSNVNVIVTGHSLGGALSPAFALYYKSHIANATNPTVWCFSTAGATPGNNTFATNYNNALGNNTIKAWNFYDVVPRAWVPSLLTAVKSTKEGKFPFIHYKGGLYDAAGSSVFFDSTYSCGGAQKAEPAKFKPTATPGMIDTLIDGAINKSQANNYTHICNGGQSFNGPGNGNLYVDIVPYDPTNPFIWVLGIGKSEYEFISQLGNEHVAAYTLHYRIKPIHEYMKQMVEQSPYSVANLCMAKSNSQGKKIPAKIPVKFSMDKYSNLIGAIELMGWNW